MAAIDFPSSPTSGQVFGNYIYDATVGVWRTTPNATPGLPAGAIMQWAGNIAPNNWLICDGSAVSRATYASLFAAIGTSYGAGDSSTTFNLPDLRGRVPVGKNSGTFNTLGATGGSETHTHGSSTMTAGAYVNYWATRSGSSWTATNSGGFQAPGASTTTGTNGTAIFGNTDAGSTLQPYQVVNYIIKTSAGATLGDSELATRVGNVETLKSPINSPTFTGTVILPSTTSIGNVSSTELGYLDGVSSALQTQLDGKAASSHTHAASAITSGQLDSARMPAGSVVQVTRKRTSARSAYGYNGDTIISDLNIVIYPKFASSMLMVQWQVSYETDYNSVFRVYRDGGLVYQGGYQGYNENDGNTWSGVAPAVYDTDTASTPQVSFIQYFVPANSTAGTTLQLSIRSSIPTGATFYLNRTVNSGGASAYEVGVSTAICWEIAQ